MLKKDKEDIINMIMHLRTDISELATNENSDKVDEAQRKLNTIQDSIFIL